MSSASLVKTAIDKFKVDETAPFFAIAHTGSYGSSSSGLKNENVLKFKDNVTKSVIKKSGILGSNFNTVPSPAKTQTILRYQDNSSITNDFYWCDTSWSYEYSLPTYSYTDIYNDVTQIIGQVPYRDTLTNVLIGNKVTNISRDAFKNCSDLETINIPISVTSIGRDAFKGCTSLETIIMPYSLINIGSGAFDGCTSLSSVTLPDSGLTIGYEAFKGCTALTTITISNIVNSIGSNAFLNSGLENVILPYPNSIYEETPAVNVDFYGAIGVNISLPTS